MTPSLTLAGPVVQHMLVLSSMCVSLSLSSWDVFELSHRCHMSSSLASDLVPLVVIAGRSRGSFGWSPFLAPLLCLHLWSSGCCLASSARTWARLHLRTPELLKKSDNEYNTYNKNNVDFHLYFSKYNYTSKENPGKK